MQKFPAEEFTATAKLKVSAKDDGQLSGLIIMGWDYSWIGVEKQEEKFLLKQAVCKDAEQGNLEQVSTLAVLEPSRKFEAGLFPNYEREIYIRYMWTKGHIVALATVWMERNLRRPARCSKPVRKMDWCEGGNVQRNSSWKGAWLAGCRLVSCGKIKEFRYEN